MIGWLVAGGYLLAGLIASRWTVGTFIKEVIEFPVDWSEPDEAFPIGLIFVLSLLFWPVAAVGAVAWGIGVGVARSPLRRWIRWFYTLDRRERKELLSK